MSGGVQGSNDRAGEERANCPSEGMPSPTQAKFTQPPELPSSAVEIGDLFLVHLVVSGFEVQLLWKCFWCTKSEFGVEFVRSTPPL